MSYSNYLNSTHWKNKRQEKLSSVKHGKPQNICRICGTNDKLNIHHKFYKDKNGETTLFNEDISQLITLCSSCHSLWHKFCHEKRDGDGELNYSKKIMFIREMLSGGAKKSWAFRLVGMGVMSAGIYKVRKYYKK